MQQALELYPYLTKVSIPRRPSRLISRPRLLSLLACNPAPRLILIRAPAGFGKTTLLADFAYQTRVPVSWLSIDAQDRDARTFLDYLALGVHQASPQIQPIAIEPDADEGQLRRALGLIVSRLQECREEIVIILDDLQFIADSDSVLRLADEFVRRKPDHLRLIIASRLQPELACLPRLRVEKEVIELGPNDLAFTAEEILDFYKAVHERDISRREAEELFLATEGWPAALVLASEPELALRLRGALADEMFDYLSVEVMAGLPHRLRDFLFTVSIFDPIDPRIVDGVRKASNSAVLLKEIEKRSVPLARIGNKASRYRLHPLFREFLVQRLRSGDPTRLANLHRRAGASVAEQGLWNEAIHHFSQAEDWNKVAQLILRAAPVVYNEGKWHIVISWLEAIPPRELRARTQLKLWEARIRARLGQTDEALRLTNELVEDPHGCDPSALAELETIRAMALRVKGDMRWALASCQRAVDLAAKGDAPVHVLAEAKKQLGHVLFALGSYAEAVREFRSVLEIYEQRGDIAEMAFMNGCLGSALGSLGNLAESAIHLEQARQQWSKLGNAKELSWVLNNLGMVYGLIGQVDLARDFFVDALKKARESGHQRFEAYTLISLADLDRQSGQAKPALTRYEEALRLAGDLDEMTLSTHALVGLGHTYRQMGEMRKAEVLAQQALASAQERQSTFEQGLVQMLLGSLWRQHGRPGEAISAFSTAATLFETVSSKRELAEALFYLADSSLKVRRSRNLLKVTLEKLASIASELGHDYFLLQAVKEAPRVAQYGASRRIGGGFYRQLLRRCLEDPSAIGGTSKDDRIDKNLPLVEVNALGGMEIELDGRKVLDWEWESEKAKEVFLLLLTEDRHLRRDEIVATIWPEAGGSRASSLFHSTVYRVRRALYFESLVESRGAYVINRQGTFKYDVRNFRGLARMVRGMSDDDGAYIETLRAAMALYRGPFAPELEGEWAQARRLELEAMFLELAARLADKLFHQGDLRASIEVSERVLEYDPYNEAACYRLMKAYADLENYEAALRVYRRLTEVLEIDIGEKPGRAILQLYAEVRDQLARAACQPP